MSDHGENGGGCDCDCGCTDIRALRQDRLAAVLFVMGAAPTIPFIVATSRVDGIADLCEKPLYSLGAGALGLMWCLLLVVWLVFTSKTPVGPCGRLGLMLLMLGGIILAAFNFQAYDDDSYCNRYGATGDVKLFTDSQLGASVMLLVYSVFPLSGFVFWFFFACCILYPHYLLYAMHKKTLTLASIEWFSKEWVAGNWLAVPDENAAVPNLSERYPPPARRIPLLIPMAITYFGLGIPAIIRLVDLSDPVRYAKLQCENPLWAGAFAQLIGMGFMFAFMWASFTARRPSTLRASLSHFTMLGMLVFSIINMAWYDNEGSCKATYLSECKYSYSSPCRFTSDQQSLTDIHVALSVVTFIWSLFPLTFWLLWGAVLALVVAPGLALWTIISRSSAGCCNMFGTVAKCWWREEDEDDWDDDLEPSVLAARKQRAADGIGSAPGGGGNNATVVPESKSSVDMKEVKEAKIDIIAERERQRREERERREREEKAERDVIAARQQREERQRAAEERERARQLREASRQEILEDRQRRRREREAEEALERQKREQDRAADEAMAAKQAAIQLPSAPSSGSLSIRTSGGGGGAPLTISVSGRPSAPSVSDAPPAYVPPVPVLTGGSGAAPATTPIVPPGGVPLDIPAVAPPPYDPSAPPAAGPPKITTIEEMAFCGNCGTQRFDRADRFCRKCGTPIVA